MASKSATIETLTAQVRVLMVGNRQITASVYAQLDMVGESYIKEFGRVNFRAGDPNYIYVVGRQYDGTPLVRSRTPKPEYVKEFVRGKINKTHGFPAGCLPSSEIEYFKERGEKSYSAEYRENMIKRLEEYEPIFNKEWDLQYAYYRGYADLWSKLGLIVLAGLR